MGYAIKNSETGEIDYVHSDSGPIVQSCAIDEETGEPLNCTREVRYVKQSHFQIPKKYLRSTRCEEFDNVITGDYQEGSQWTPIQVTHRPEGGLPPKPEKSKKEQKKNRYKREDYINMEGVQKDIILGYNKKNIILFLIPTFFFFNIYLGMFLSLMEMFLHFWSHKKNGLNMNKSVYYRSPLHVLTSEFCAICRSESEMDIRVFDMLNKQMRQARESKTLKNVSKAIS